MEFGRTKNGEKSRKNIGRVALLLLVLLAGAGFFYAQKKKGLGTGESLEHIKVEDGRSQEQSQSDFDALLQTILAEEVTDNSITLNYLMKNPSDYGITEQKPTLGSYSLSDLQNNIMVSENHLAVLDTFDYDKLTEEQKLIYDILREVLDGNLQASEMLEYSECLGPTSGIQAQLPVLLAEYNFYQQQDVETYLSVLRQVPDYFEEILSFEQMKSERQLFMSDTTAQAIIDQCEDFVSSPEENYLIEMFEQKIGTVDGLTQKEQKKYIRQNKKAVLEAVIPAYEELISGIEELKGTGVNQGGLFHFEKGKEYYEYLVKVMTGSNRTLEEIDSMLEENLNTAQKQVEQIMSDSPDSYYDAQNANYPYQEPTEAIVWLEKQILADFPALPEGINCAVKYVDESLEDSMSPAFYLTPPMDAYEENVIYINQRKEYDLSQAFPTIAHESYPGHLYQNCYFQATDPHPVRNMVNVGGYTEGWGTYAELYSYQMAGLDENVAKLLQQNTLATLCIYARADLLVNGKGWSYQKLNDYLEGFGFDSSQSKIIFDSMVAEPASYMQYTLGYLEIEALVETAKNKLGDHFSLKAFHEFFLEIGPAPYSVIQDRFENWIQEQQTW